MRFGVAKKLGKENFAYEMKRRAFEPITDSVKLSFEAVEEKTKAVNNTTGAICSTSKTAQEAIADLSHRHRIEKMEAKSFSSSILRNFYLISLNLKTEVHFDKWMTLIELK